VLALSGAGAAQWFNVNADIDDHSLSTPDAFAAAEAGDITLVDIRRPDEWARTGVPKAGIPLDMRREDFVDVLLSQPGVDKDKPIALICARGVRSRRMSERLKEAGFTKIIDVPEGMLGSGAGPGWLKRGLPVVKP
jgi:rhodanese-related sulfurtransferase